MISHNLKSGDEYGVARSVNLEKILVQITSNTNEEEARGVFTREEARDLIREIEKQLSK